MSFLVNYMDLNGGLFGDLVFADSKGTALEVFRNTYPDALVVSVEIL